MKPILVIGARPTFARVITEVCAQRDLRCELGGADVTDPAAVGRMFERHAPWLVIDAGWQVELECAEADRDALHLAQVAAGELLARECARRCAHLVSLSSVAALGETDDHALVAAEQRVCSLCPASLVARVGALFGAHRAPTFAPDLVHAVLDLAIDGAVGVWHLATAGVTLSPLADARRARPSSSVHLEHA